jgi:transposase InsO family protein
MRRYRIQGLRLRRRVQTTVPDPAAAKAPDLIGRDFTAGEINQRYVGDITYLPVGERGFLYLATVIEVASQERCKWRRGAAPWWSMLGRCGGGLVDVLGVSLDSCGRVKDLAAQLV